MIKQINYYALKCHGVNLVDYVYYESFPFISYQGQVFL